MLRHALHQISRLSPNVVASRYSKSYSLVGLANASRKHSSVTGLHDDDVPSPNTQVTGGPDSLGQPPGDAIDREHQKQNNPISALYTPLRTDCAEKVSPLGNATIPALPAPPPIPDYPCPRIDLDADPILPALHARHWTVIANPLKSLSGPHVNELAKTFAFNSFKTAVEFANAVMTLATQEKHHPAITIDFRLVHIHTHTHSACAPSLPGMDSKSKLRPGITARDLRFALELERIHAETFAARAREPSAGSRLRFSPVGTLVRPRPGEPWAPQTELAVPSATIGKRARRTCPICGSGEHLIADCSQRHTVLPPRDKPCSRCGGWHWRINCTAPHARWRGQKTVPHNE